MAPARVVAVAAAATILSVIAPLISYLSYPSQADQVTGVIAGEHVHPLEAGVKTLKAVKGHVEVQGSPAGLASPRDLLLKTSRGTLVVRFTGCWASPDGGILAPAEAASLAASSPSLTVNGLLVELEPGRDVLLAESVRVDGLTLLRTHCHGRHAPGRGGHGHHASRP